MCFEVYFSADLIWKRGGMNGLTTTQHDLNPRGGIADDTIDCHVTTRLIQWSHMCPCLTKGTLTRDVESHWSNRLVRPDSVYYALLPPAQLQNRKVTVSCLGWTTLIAPATRFGCEPTRISRQVFQDPLYDNRTSECLEIVVSQEKSSVGAGKRDPQAMVDAL